MDVESDQKGVIETNLILSTTLKLTSIIMNRPRISLFEYVKIGGVI